jgi:acyl carrier protein
LCKDKEESELEEGVLVAYLRAPNWQTSNPDTHSLGSEKIEQVRSHLLKALPLYMVPAYYLLVEFIPLTPNGKVDRHGLPNLNLQDLAGANFVEPVSEVEKVVAEIWQSVLKVEQVGLNDNFFNLGGHSLLATRVLARVKATYQMELPLRSLFEDPTLGNMTKYIETTLWVRDGGTSASDVEGATDGSDDDREEFEF